MTLILEFSDDADTETKAETTVVSEQVQIFLAEVLKAVTAEHGEDAVMAALETAGVSEIEALLSGKTFDFPVNDILETLLAVGAPGTPDLGDGTDQSHLFDGYVDVDKQKGETVYTLYDDKGNVKRLLKLGDDNTYDDYHYEGGRLIWSEHLTDDDEFTAEYEHDKDGNVTGGKTYHGEVGVLRGGAHIERDEEGRVEKITYHKDGKVTKVTEHFHDEDGGETVVQEDGEGNVQKITEKDKDGNVTSTREYERDADGNLSKSTHRNGDGEVTETVEYEYDEEGNLVATTRRAADGKLIVREEYTEDEKKEDGDAEKLRDPDHDMATGGGGDPDAVDQKDPLEPDPETTQPGSPDGEGKGEGDLPEHVGDPTYGTILTDPDQDMFVFIPIHATDPTYGLIDPEGGDPETGTGGSTGEGPTVKGPGHGLFVAVNLQDVEESPIQIVFADEIDFV